MYFRLPGLPTSSSTKKLKSRLQVFVEEVMFTITPQTPYIISEWSPQWRTQKNSQLSWKFQAWKIIITLPDFPILLSITSAASMMLSSVSYTIKCHVTYWHKCKPLKDLLKLVNSASPNDPRWSCDPVLIQLWIKFDLWEIIHNFLWLI